MNKLMVVLWMLCGCSVDVETEPNGDVGTEVLPNVEYGEESLITYEDPENNVICYRVQYYTGIACIVKDKK